MTLLQATQSKLNGINNSIVSIIAQNVDEETGEISPEVLEHLDKLQLSKDEITKVAGISYHQYKSLAEQVTAEKKRLYDLEKMYKNSMESFKKMMDKILGGDSFECESFKCSYRKSKSIESIEDFDIDEFEKEYPVFVKVTKELRKAEIKSKFKNSDVLPPGIILKEKQNLVIK